jgi:hypothetical protein
MKKPVPCAQPCGSCPWRLANQTPEAVQASPIDGRGVHWFDHENLRDRWEGIADGQMLPCHVTDSRAPLYGGKPAKGKGKETLCVGQAILAHREITAFMSDGTDFNCYRRRPGIRFTAKGLASWASRLYYAGATLLIERRELIIPKVTDNPDVGLPEFEP